MSTLFVALASDISQFYYTQERNSSALASQKSYLNTPPLQSLVEVGIDLNLRKLWYEIPIN
jgi:hypothetical protein